MTVFIIDIPVTAANHDIIEDLTRNERGKQRLREKAQSASNVGEEKPALGTKPCIQPFDMQLVEEKRERSNAPDYGYKASKIIRVAVNIRYNIEKQKCEVHNRQCVNHHIYP